jgi:DNA primase
MGKTYINVVKYNIKAKFEVNGLVDKHDIIGAVFGQSEGLIGEDLDLRELQKKGKIGRIDIFPTPSNGKTTGTLNIPSSLDMVQTSILAAAIESIEKVGPYESKFQVEKIEDTRTNKREEIKNRAKELLNKFLKETSNSAEIAEEVRESSRIAEIQSWGPENLPAGPDIEKEEEIILVEGRADVLNLLKNNIKNVIGMNGSKIPSSIPSLCERKTIVLFTDGDRGGELIQRQLMNEAKIDFVARAPDGKEVEELTKKEITMALRKKVPVSSLKKQTLLKPRIQTQRFSSFSRNRLQRRHSGFRSKTYTRSFARKYNLRTSRAFEIQRQMQEPEIKIEASEEEKRKFEPLINSVKGKMEAIILDEKGNELKRTKIRELVPSLKELKQVDSIVLDGIITKRLVEEAKKHSVKYIIGVKKGKIKETGEIKTLIM